MSLLSDNWINRNLDYLVNRAKSKDVRALGLMSQVNPSSLDLTLGGNITRHIWEGGYLPENIETKNYSREDGETFWFMPGNLYICHSREYIEMPPDVSAMLTMKSTPARQGLTHLMAGFVEAGFVGTVTLEFYAIIPVRVKIGQRLVQLSYFTQEQASDRQYRGKYFGQTGAQGAIEGESIY